MDLLANQAFTTAGCLVDYVDKKVMVMLRDGRKVFGFLRSYDQFANLVLQETVERIYVQQGFSDIEHGVFLIRGENVVLLGEMDLAIDELGYLQELPLKLAQQQHRKEVAAEQELQRRQQAALHQQGFANDQTANDLY